jgi:hypothetical protein
VRFEMRECWWHRHNESLTKEMEPELNPVTILPCFWTEMAHVGVSSLMPDTCRLPWSVPVAEFHRVTTPALDTVSSLDSSSNTATHTQGSEASPRTRRAGSAVSKSQALT